MIVPRRLCIYFVTRWGDTTKRCPISKQSKTKTYLHFFDGLVTFDQHEIYLDEDSFSPREKLTCSKGGFMNHRISFEVKLLRSLQLVYECNMLLVAGSQKKNRSAWVPRFLNYEIHHHTSRILPSKHRFDRVLSGFFWGVAWMETKILQGSKGQNGKRGHVLASFARVWLIFKYPC